MFCATSLATLLVIRPTAAEQEDVERGVGAIQLQSGEDGNRNMSDRHESRWTDDAVASTSGRPEPDPQLQVRQCDHAVILGRFLLAGWRPCYCQETCTMEF